MAEKSENDRTNAAVSETSAYRPGEIEGGGGLKVTYAHGTAPVVLRIPTEGGVVTELRPIFHAARLLIHKRTASRPLSDFSGLGRLDD